MQLIRVRHDYRLYGKGSTMLVGNPIRINSKQRLGEWAGISPNCWKEYKGNYIVGKEAYKESIDDSSGNGFIKNSTHYIGPYTCYGIAPHTHTIDLQMTSLQDTISYTKSVITSMGTGTTEHGLGKMSSGNGATNKPWKDVITDLLAGTGRSEARKGGFATAINVATTNDFSGRLIWRCGWNSSNCQLLPTGVPSSEIFEQHNTFLPTYASRIWKWNKKDDTSISNIYVKEIKIYE